MRPMLNTLFLRASLVLVGLVFLLGAKAQRIQGSFARGTALPVRIVLYETWGGAHLPIDSVSVDRKGRFAFPAGLRQAGFYRLVAGPEDVVDLIIDPREAIIELHFSGRPIQEHITVRTSLQNQRLWEYKRASREGQARLAGIQEERKKSSALDAGAQAALAQREAEVKQWQQGILERLVANDPDGPFERIVLTDGRLVEAVPLGSDAVRSAVDWADPTLIRSSVYPKAVMAYLQNLPNMGVPELIGACDSLLEWSSNDAQCWSFSRSFLIRLFSVYGPDAVAQHLVDRYIVGSGSLHPPEAEVLEAAAELLRVAAGAKAPEVFLVDPVAGDTTLLQRLLSEQPYTVLFFYSSSCDHCHEQMPGLLHVYGDLRPKGVQVLGIALDVDLEEFRMTLDERGLLWPSFSELNGWGGTSAKAFGVKSTPSFFLLDESGTILAKPYDHVELRAKLMELLP